MNLLSVKFYCISIFFAAFIFSSCSDFSDSTEAEQAKKAVASFLEDLNEGHFEDALKHWNNEAKENIENNSGLEYEVFFKKYFLCESFNLGPVYRGKSGYLLVEFEGVKEGEIKRYTIPLLKINGSFKIIEDELNPEKRERGSKDL
jgi:DNA polymerase elongation subunit (family B)